MGTLGKILNREQSPSLSMDDHSPPPPSAASTAELEHNDPQHPGPQQPQEPQPVQPVYYDHPIHPDCPDTLACLPDTDGRPQHTLPVILRCAILGSPRRRLTIREIYAAMEEKYPYYKTAGQTWKQSVRHHLSLNRLFERVPRPVTDPGFGSYWTVNLLAPPGTKRPRKRGRNKDKEKEKEKEGASESGNAHPPRTSENGEVQQVRRRGRPRNPPDLVVPNTVRGAEAYYHKASYPSYRDADAEDEDYESENEMVYPYEQRHAITHMNARVTAAAQHHPRMSFPNFGGYMAQEERPEAVIERLQMEIAGLRKQSAEAVSISLRLSDQLAEAQAEASRTRSQLRDAEGMLENEARKRNDVLDELSEAKRFAENESRLRRAAEEALLRARSGRRSDEG